jgi:hypothetical protein
MRHYLIVLALFANRRYRGAAFADGRSAADRGDRRVTFLDGY